MLNIIAFSLGVCNQVEKIYLPLRAPGIRQLADIFHLDAHVHKKDPYTNWYRNLIKTAYF